jgi:hypothetical protein
MKYNHYRTLLTPAAAFLLMEMFFFWPKLIYVALVMAVLIFFFTVRQFTLAAKRQEKWWNYLILPAGFFAGNAVFSAMIPSPWFIQFMFAVNWLFNILYFRTIYYYLLRVEKYQAQRLENISSYGNFLAFYFIASSVYGLQIFLNIDIWVLIIGLLFFIFLIVYQVFWANGIDIHLGLFYAIIISLVLVEIAWSASFLTLNFYILGLLLAVCYYILIGLARFYLLSKLSNKIIKLYLIFGFSSILLVLFTANWLSYG